MATRSDLTGYAALLGEGFASRIDLLGRILQEAHYPSLGRYKERLLANTIRDYLPRSVEVGTGFVLFPHEDHQPPGGVEHHDPLNRCTFTLSRQCDIIVFDSNSIPLVFRDEDFVVVRPESVRAVIEVKGSLTIKETQKLLESFVDFGRKWRNTQLFYKSHYQALTPYPALFAMAWKIKERSDGRRVTTPSKIRDSIADYYAKNLDEKELDGLPLLRHLFIYDESEISGRLGNDDLENVLPMNFGWCSADGRFKRFKENGEVYRDKDRTIASLLAALHLVANQDYFNAFFSYTDETRDDKLLPYDHYGISWAWKNIASTKERTFNADKVY